MKNLLFLLVLLALAGCADDVQPVNTYETTPITRIMFATDTSTNVDVPVCLFTFTQKHHLIDGSPADASTTLVIKNTSSYVVTLNYVVSGSAWRYVNALVDLQPGQVLDVGEITKFYDSYNPIYITIQSAYLVPAAAG